MMYFTNNDWGATIYSLLCHIAAAVLIAGATDSLHPGPVVMIFLALVLIGLKFETVWKKE